jgi:carbamoyl-phosphate synthase large subunit
MSKEKLALDSKKFGILFTCIGRRVSLLNSFKRAAKSLKIDALFLGTDTTTLSPALQLCDEGFLLKPIIHKDYLKQLLSIVRNSNVKLLVPTVDLDLKLLAENKEQFEKLGCKVLVSKPDIIDICQNKKLTYKFLSSNGFSSPVTMTPDQALAKNELNWPCFLKPWDGYASRGNAIVKNFEELKFFSQRIPNCIVQEFVKGTEFTCDIYVDFGMNVRCVVPRKRIETRAGEVSKGQVIKNPIVMAEAKKVIETLGAGPGVITLQLFLTSDNKIISIEVNPRFGGGAPLSIKAGANFPKWILQELTGKKPRIKFDGFEDNLIMLRFDSEVWAVGNFYF